MTRYELRERLGRIEDAIREAQLASGCNRCGEDAGGHEIAVDPAVAAEHAARLDLAVGELYQVLGEPREVDLQRLWAIEAAARWCQTVGYFDEWDDMYGPFRALCEALGPEEQEDA